MTRRHPVDTRCGHAANHQTGRCAYRCTPPAPNSPANPDPTTDRCRDCALGVMTARAVQPITGAVWASCSHCGTSRVVEDT